MTLTAFVCITATFSFVYLSAEGEPVTLTWVLVVVFPQVVTNIHRNFAQRMEPEIGCIWYAL